MSDNGQLSDAFQKIPVQDWDLLRLLVCVARSGSIATASTQLSESPATVGRKLRELEKSLSLPLFERGSSGVTLTPIGDDILQIAQRIETELCHMGEVARGHLGFKGSRVSVTAPEGFGASVLAPKLIEFHSLNPHIKIDLLLSNKKTNLHNREADIAVRLGEPEAYRVNSEKLGVVKFGIYASREYLCDLEPIRSLEEFLGHNVIVATGALSQTVQETEFRKITGKCNVAARTDNVNAQLMAVRSGLGFAALPKFMAAGHSDLIEALPGFLTQSLDLWILTHSDIAPYPYVQTTTEFLTQVCKDIVELE